MQSCFPGTSRRNPGISARSEPPQAPPGNLGLDTQLADGAGGSLWPMLTESPSEVITLFLTRSAHTIPGAEEALLSKGSHPQVGQPAVPKAHMVCPPCRALHRWMTPWPPATWSSSSSLRTLLCLLQPWASRLALAGPCARRPGVHWP